MKMKKMHRVFTVLFCVLAAGAFLFVSVPSVVADPFYLNNGDFESGGTGWSDYADSPGEIGVELIGDFGSNCYAGNCLRLSGPELTVLQPINPTERYLIVFAYVSTSAGIDDGDACITLRAGFTIYADTCNLVDGEWSGWVWECFSNHNFNELGTINYRLESNALNEGEEIHFDNVGANYVHDCPGDLVLPTEPTEWPVFAITATCPISLTTSEISGTETITTTETVVVPANILSNISFEEGGVFPNYWQSDVPLDAAGTYRRAAPSLARTGDDLLVIQRKPELTYFQTITVPTSGEYVFGGHNKYVNAGYGTFIYTMRFSLNGANAISTDMECTGSYNMTCNYEEITGTVNLTPGQYDFTIHFANNLQNPDEDFAYHVDDAFMIPISGTLVNCPAVQEHYSQTVPPAPSFPPEGQFPVDTVGGIPIPIGGAGTVCYECRFPQNGIFSEPAWAIAWLGCVIRNMFSCSLRVWLYEIVNVLRATLVYLYVWGNWQSSTVQGGANWLAGGYSQVANYLSATSSQIQITISTGASQGTSWLDMLYLFVELLGILLNVVLGILRLLFYALNILLQIVFGLFSILYNALDVPAYTIADFNGGVEPTAGLGGYGATNSKIYLGIMWGFQSIDNLFVAMGFGPLFSFAIGILGISVFRGMIRQWQSITPI